METIISSRENPVVKMAVGLAAHKKERDASGLFLAEGSRLCMDALKSGVGLETLLITEQAEKRYEQVAELRQAAARIYRIAEHVSEKISDAKTPQGVYAVCRKLDNLESAGKINRYGRYLLLYGMQNPGNLGAVLRTADALGVSGVFLGADCADLYSPKTLRGSMGAVFRLPVILRDDLTDAVIDLRGAGVPVWAAALTQSARPLQGVDLSRGGAVLIGNEGSGLPQHLMDACTGCVAIPMAEGANSLNAAVAAGIFMWEMRRQSPEANS